MQHVSARLRLERQYSKTLGTDSAWSCTDGQAMKHLDNAAQLLLYTIEGRPEVIEPTHDLLIGVAALHA